MIAAPARATFVLSFHASYACRDRGACCTAGWPIPVEAEALARAERAIDEGRLRTPCDTSNQAVPAASHPESHAFFYPANAPPETPALVARTMDACVFYRQGGTARCTWHRALGHASLPLACRQFPRVSLIDPRGVSITLSHFCPTAADLLDADTTVSVMANGAAFPASADYAGLDVRQALPPALRPDMLMDWESWWLWEHETVALLGAVEDPDEALARLGQAVNDVRVWRPEDGPLSAAIARAFYAARNFVPRVDSARALGAHAADVLASVPDDHRDEAIRALHRRSASPSRRAHQRFLVAHAFANWTAHLGEGLRTWLRSVEAAHALVTSGRSVRDADLLLRHLADPHKLVEIWGGVERD